MFNWLLNLWRNQVYAPVFQFLIHYLFPKNVDSLGYLAQEWPIKQAVLK